MVYKLGVLYGDGIGEEIVEATVNVLEAAASYTGLAKFELEDLPMGETAIQEYNDPMPEITKEKLTEVDGWILGPHDSASYPHEYKEKRNPSGELRHVFDLYANIRPTKSLPGIKGVIEGNADLVIYRENTEGFYTDRNMYIGVGEWMITPDVAVATGVFTRKAIERIARAAFESAMERRKKVTIVHKANVIRLGTGLFKNICLEIAKEYPEVEVNDYHIDAMTAHLVRHIHHFDVIVTENMFGDILSDLTGELAGSLGLAPSININDNQGMAQAAHGSAPDIAGKNIANPVGIMLSTVMLLEWLGKRHDDKNLFQLARLIESAIFKAMEDGATTPDLGGNESTSSFAEAIIRRVNI
ncbi:isocitrate/isopropylmalate dehydrogenase family protein [Oceanobacillus oncorhynchi subsp. oncorhynchi]|uniref:isocitrate/isopropylmalate dehydrogenase family protein n=1 Tax=Oceanobacillus oncorhynchi TaxID=545501 RepID=UPI00337B2A9F